MLAEVFLRRTFELARLGLGTTWPNPLVGSVIVKNGRIIGEGYHHQAGLDHAELDALKNCTESPEGSTVYVNLEPCCHTNKKTPPCAQRLIQEKIKKVVICNLDPNPSVNGKGVELLRAHGIEVEYGILESEGEKLNEVFFHAQRTKRPFIHFKVATTLDGRSALSNGESQWISGERSRELVHVMRSHVQGIIVGAQTLRQDHPKLNVRLPGYKGSQPKRIIFTESGHLPLDSHLFTDENRDNTLIFTKNKINIDFHSTQIIHIENLKQAMHELFERKIISLLLEGGPTLAAAFMKEKLINRMTLFMSPSFLGQGRPAIGDFGLTKLNERPFLKNLETTISGEDLLITGTF